MCDKLIKKINSYKAQDVFIIFYSKWCPYCVEAITVLKSNNKLFKGYNIDKMSLNISDLLECFVNNKNVINFNPNHKTRPIIFYRGKFIGGLSDLKLFLN